MTPRVWKEPGGSCSFYSVVELTQALCCFALLTRQPPSCKDKAYLSPQHSRMTKRKSHLTVLARKLNRHAEKGQQLLRASGGLEKGNRKLPSQRYLLHSRRSQLLFWQGNFSLLGKRNPLSAWNKRALKHFCSLPLSTPSTAISMPHS